MTIQTQWRICNMEIFSHKKNGTLILYWLYSKDDGIRKDSGIVLICSSRINSTFFNNYSSGLLFKNSFFSKYSLRLQKKSF